MTRFAFGILLASVFPTLPTFSMDTSSPDNDKSALPTSSAGRASHTSYALNLNSEDIHTSVSSMDQESDAVYELVIRSDWVNKLTQRLPRRKENSPGVLKFDIAYRFPQTLIAEKKFTYGFSTIDIAYEKAINFEDLLKFFFNIILKALL